MGTLKQVSSSVRPTTSPANALTSVDEAKSQGQAIAGFGKAAQGIALKWNNAFNSTLKTEKDNEFSLGKSKILKEAQDSLKLDDMEDYVAELEKFNTSSTEGFTDNTYRDAYEKATAYEVELAKAELDAIYKKKLLVHNDAQGIIKRSDYYTKYMNDGDEKWIMKAIAQTNIALEDGFKKEDIAAKERVAAQGWKEERVKGQKVKDEIIKRQVKVNQIQNELDLFKKVMEVGIDGVSNESILSLAGDEEDGYIGHKTAEVVMNYKNDPVMYKKSLKDDKGFTKSLELILLSDNKKAVNNYLIDILSKKEVKKDNLTVLVHLANLKSQGLLGVEVDEGEEIEKTGVLQSVWAAISSPFIKEEDKTQAIKNTVDGIEKGEDPVKAFMKSQQQAMLERYPFMAAYPDEGVPKADKNGNVIRWFPDGRGVPE